MDYENFGDQLSIWGRDFDQRMYQRFEFVLVPCNYVHAEFGPTNDFIAEGCISDY